MSVFLDLLPREKSEAILRGERVEISGEESQRFQIAFNDCVTRNAHERKTMIEKFPGTEHIKKSVYIAPFASPLTFRCGRGWKGWDFLPDLPPMSLEIGEGLSMNVYVHPDTPALLRALADQAEELLCALAEEKAERLEAHQEQV